MNKFVVFYSESKETHWIPTTSQRNNSRDINAKEPMYNETNLENILGERPRMLDPNFPVRFITLK